MATRGLLPVLLLSLLCSMAHAETPVLADASSEGERDRWDELIERGSAQQAGHSGDARSLQERRDRRQSIRPSLEVASGVGYHYFKRVGREELGRCDLDAWAVPMSLAFGLGRGVGSRWEVLARLRLSSIRLTHQVDTDAFATRCPDLEATTTYRRVFAEIEGSTRVRIGPEFSPFYVGASVSAGPAFHMASQRGRLPVVDRALGLSASIEIGFVLGDLEHFEVWLRFPRHVYAASSSFDATESNTFGMDLGVRWAFR
jgi:hypothetical protein